MRKRADWMRPADDRILEYLHSEGPNLPTNMADKLDLSRKYIGERCRKLAAYGLVENLGEGLYRITENGTEFLEGKLDARTLEQRERV